LRTGEFNHSEEATVKPRRV